MLPGVLARTLSYRFGEIGPAVGEKKGVNQIYMVVSAVVMMLILLGYVWSQVNMTKLEYNVASQYELRRKLLEEQKRLNGELAVLKAPKRIEVVARGSLGLSYPEMDQIVFIK